MNEDHGDALRRMATHYGTRPAESPTLVACDPEGAHLRNGETVLYLPFAAAAFDRDAVRAAMIQLAKDARNRDSRKSNEHHES